MWKLFRWKIKEAQPPVTAFRMQFRITYTTAHGLQRTTGLIDVTVPARTMKEAGDKLKRFALKRVAVKIENCEKQFLIKKVIISKKIIPLHHQSNNMTDSQAIKLECLKLAIETKKIEQTGINVGTIEGIASNYAQFVYGVEAKDTEVKKD